MSNFILDPSLQSALPVFCFCDAEDGEKTSILGIEKGKNRELVHYKIIVSGPVPVSHPSIQFEMLKLEMAFLTDNGEVNLESIYRCTVIITSLLLLSFLVVLSLFMKHTAVF